MKGGFLRNTVCNAKLFSWNEASNICHKVSGHLPQFLDRVDQELIYLLKKSYDLYLIEALFTGLKIKNKPRLDDYFNSFSAKLTQFFL